MLIVLAAGAAHFSVAADPAGIGHLPAVRAKPRGGGDGGPHLEVGVLRLDREQ